jgi:hypothetical protein
MSNPDSKSDQSRSKAQPILGQRSKETQAFGTLTRYPLGRATAPEPPQWRP